MDIVALAGDHPKVGETVFGTDLKYFPGGKGANQAVASAKLGAYTVLIGMVGADGFGKELVAFLKNQKIENRISIQKKAPTGTALITVSAKTSDNTIVVIPGANFKLTEKELKKVKFTKDDVLVSQFEIPIKTITAFFKRGKKAGTINIFNPAPAKSIPKELFTLIDILILNETELALLSKTKVVVSNKNSIQKAVNKIRNHNQTIIVTIGAKGSISFIKDSIIEIPGRKVKAVDTTGAGDCFVGAIASQLSKKIPIEQAIRFATIAASISVTRQGAGSSMPTLDEVK